MASKKTTKKTAKKATKQAAKKASAKKPTKKSASKSTSGTSSARAKKKPSTKPAPSNKALYDRLLVKSQTLHIVDPPVGFEINVPAGCGLGFELPPRLGRDDALMAFVRNKAGIDALAKQLKKALRADEESLVWLVYPKGTGRVATDISRDRGWDAVTALGYQGVAVVAVDDDWSALRVRHESRTTRRS